MRRWLSSRGLFIPCFLLLAFTNIIVLAGVAANRSGLPESQLVLSERELLPPYRQHGENSALALRLSWRALAPEVDENRFSDWRIPAWLSPDKVRELGFTLSPLAAAEGDDRAWREPLPKEVFWVLEYDGEAYQESLARAEAALERTRQMIARYPDDKQRRQEYEQAEQRCERERKEASRLFVVDAGLDSRALRERYHERSRFLITKGMIRLRYDREGQTVQGALDQISVERISVPLASRRVLDPILARKRSEKDEEDHGPRYEVTLAYGHRLEPWIAALRPLAEGSP